MNTSSPKSAACTDHHHDQCPDVGMPAPLCLCSCHKSGLTTRTFSASGAGIRQASGESANDDETIVAAYHLGQRDGKRELRDLIDKLAPGALDKAVQLVNADPDSEFVRQHLNTYARECRNVLAQLLAAAGRVQR